ncbi:MAG: Stp1/IreP family PP2C-type Ser/Thr phosphatase [Deltaproteobacteria bacterium]|nr:Stp1/IreP family PP2C-type Ser/Thr phosphatase [Deltaproteobacteria bacterium]MBW2362131.1 Stp1/IreP family PP2C-type Ser/Thr phosphatase [Deltaproteobacteria bacterium]
MKFRWAAQTDVGQKRRGNEDCYALEPDLGLFLVADGMGGHAAGQVASDLAARASVNAMRTLTDASVSLTEKLRVAVSAANREIFEATQSKPELAGMGTTLVALLAAPERIALAHVGDSRAYLVRGGKIRQLTDDHSLVAELVRRKEITETAARGHPHRHVLTRALGVRRSVEADFAELTPAAGDTFVLCSDGLTGHIQDAEIAEHAAAEADLSRVVQGLVDEANARGGEDNITLVVIRCDED